MMNIFRALLESGEALHLALHDQDVERFDRLLRDRESLLPELTAQPKPEHPSQEWRDMARRLAEQEKSLMAAAVELGKAMADRRNSSARPRSANEPHRTAGPAAGCMHGRHSGDRCL